ncbi:Cytochrome c oxidase subunit 2 [Achromobacter veterisilvae]|uniref:Cytochrome c oxidase subunit 2 n=1 Tax=Achromobacter veterisilvae TaxID=2069367 RepID=A0A446CH11_9BURK|nr:c-type cytochrome [Achromobacter veterisilvae]SSW67149.1 Cytochrome c oxidase subunit 2 [Achromobacter veterisilvae]
MAPFIPSVLAATPPIASWAQTHSALHPRGEDAGRIADIGWVLYLGAATIFVAVAILVGMAMYGPARVRRLLGRPGLVVAAGVAFPVAVLTALLAYALQAAASMARGPEPALRIEVAGELWWWRVRYRDPSGGLLFETANDIRVPAGVTVEILLTSGNVIHSFWVPSLAGKLDLIPGRVNRLRVLAHEPGVFRGLCAEYCGAQHANMMFELHALAAPRFAEWMEAQRRPAALAQASLRQGEHIFLRDCAQCHTVRGTAAAGTAGPDLTHVGSRPTLGASVLSNNMGALAGWIAGSQHIKPGNRMPAFGHLSGEELRAVAAYLDGLK